MKAPDKIFIQPSPYYSWTPERQFEGDEEYLRKEALLEWLSDMRFMSNSERAVAYQNVIDKLNKM